MGLTAGSPHCGEGIDLLLLLEVESQPLGRPVHNLVFILTMLSQLLGYNSNREIKLQKQRN